MTLSFHENFPIWMCNNCKNNCLYWVKAPIDNLISKHNRFERKVAKTRTTLPHANNCETNVNTSIHSYYTNHHCKISNYRSVLLLVEKAKNKRATAASLFTIPAVLYSNSCAEWGRVQDFRLLFDGLFVCVYEWFAYRRYSCYYESKESYDRVGRKKSVGAKTKFYISNVVNVSGLFVTLGYRRDANRDFK